MHEVSLVRNIFKILEKEFPPEKLSRLTAITLKVGELSNVEPVLMKSAFDAITYDEKKFENTTLKLVSTPVEIECDRCGKRTRIKDYKFECSCGSTSTQIVSGLEMEICQLEFMED